MFLGMQFEMTEQKIQNIALILILCAPMKYSWWNLHRNFKELTVYSDCCWNNLSPQETEMFQGKRHSLSPSRRPCVYSDSFSKSTWDEWTWTQKVKCSGERREKSKWTSLSYSKPGQSMLWSATQISTL